MNETVAPVDYDRHPGFTATSAPWSVNEEEVRRFTHEYDLLLSTGEVNGSVLVDTARSIFNQLEAQAVDFHEECFIRELGSDLLAMVSEQVDFYRRIAMSRPSPETQSDRQRALSADGFYITSISQRTLARIHRLSGTTVKMLRVNASAGKMSRADLSVNSGRVIRSISKTLNRDFKKSGVIRSLRVLLDAPVRVVGVALELSVPGSTWWKSSAEEGNSPATLYAHVDRSVSAPKSIVYLTEVREENGPTTCYPGIYGSIAMSGLQDLVGRCLETIGSNQKSPLYDYYKIVGQPLSNERFRGHFMKLPPTVRFNSHFGWDVIKNSELEDMMLSRQHEVLGPAGTALIFDGGRLVHRGGLIEAGERVVLQVVFGRSTWLIRTSNVVRFVLKKLKGE